MEKLKEKAGSVSKLSNKKPEILKTVAEKEKIRRG